MTRFDVLAEGLYRLSLNLNKNNKWCLFRKRHAVQLTRTLSAMQFLSSCLRTETIDDDDAHIIIGTLENILHTRYFDFATDLLNAEKSAAYNAQQKGLLFDASCTISLCIGSLCNKEENYKETFRRYIATIQTITKAFLPPNHPAWLSIEDASKTIKTYLKSD